MIVPFEPGSKKIFETEVTPTKLAEFDSGVVHPVYGTFALGRDAEWACRLFVLDMLEAGEEGIGSYLSIEHLYPAPVGSQVRIESTLVEVDNNRIDCTFEAFANGQMIARGEQVQKIINKQKFDQLLERIEVK